MTKRPLQHFTILILVILSRTKSQSLPRCSDKCGNITIPYPFGIEEDCYLDTVYRTYHLTVFCVAFCQHWPIRVTTALTNLADQTCKLSHPNVVRPLGCCLETPTPLLVYEFVTNKTLFHHLHEKDSTSSMTFERRLNIATQTAEAIAHKHSTTQIIHRDIKSSNILLTDDYTAKVSDFGISRFIPLDQTHVQTLVHGTLGYIDPEYFRCIYDYIIILHEVSEEYFFT
ncbi:putative protein kinase RLK-Pelle-WAK-LRK10L-1 family [Helianthus annuus]|nr:putative protein kinase RLK-Pelle-WAK-LRK10L-1 family [Helianthus annuus]